MWNEHRLLKFYGWSYAELEETPFYKLRELQRCMDAELGAEAARNRPKAEPRSPLAVQQDLEALRASLPDYRPPED